MKSRFLSNGEKRDVIRAAEGVLKPQHPGCRIVITVADETDERGVPQYTYTVTPEPGTDTGGKD
jgi:hypothetical protein